NVLEEHNESPAVCGRGLKQAVVAPLLKCALSPAVCGRGLKLYHLMLQPAATMSPAVCGRGLKQSLYPVQFLPAGRPPCAGGWRDVFGLVLWVFGGENGVFGEICAPRRAGGAHFKAI
ncbi:MAG TPA: hypothetical protein PLR53_08995, partial [Bacteroidales bacterium]|nr:hypothetical protein [Bacteroidales bacterium]